MFPNQRPSETRNSELIIETTLLWLISWVYCAFRIPCSAHERWCSEMTTPIPLFQARRTTSLSDTFHSLAETCEQLSITKGDVYGDFEAPIEASSLRSFEREVADTFGMEDSVFMPSGTMAQSIVLAISRRKSPRFLCHFSSHILLHEKDGYRELLGMEPIIIPADESAVIQQPVTLESFEATLASAGDHLPSVAFLECPHREIGGKITPLSEIQQIAQQCREKGIHFHMDGARLWEALAAYTSESSSAKDLVTLAALFDSIYVSFYKGLGGMTGAMLLGKKDFIAEARSWLRRFGGNLFTQAPFYVSAWQGFRLNRGDFHRRRNRLREVVQAVTDALQADATAQSTQPLIRFDPPIPVVSLIHVYVATADLALAKEALETAAQRSGVKCLAIVRPARHAAAAHSCVSEFNLGPENFGIDVEHWVRGYVALQTVLREQLSK